MCVSVNALFGGVLAFVTSLAGAETIQVAVASNFAAAMRVLAERFETDTGNQERLWAGDDCLLARVTHRSARLLDLRQGKSLYAQVKSVAVVNRSPAVPMMV